MHRTGSPSAGAIVFHRFAAMLQRDYCALVATFTRWQRGGNNERLLLCGDAAACASRSDTMARLTGDRILKSMSR